MLTEPKGVVQRIVFEPVVSMEWRRFTDTPGRGVWSWTGDRTLAFVFEHYEKPGDVFSAMEHARMLKEAGERCVSPVTVGAMSDHELIQRRLRGGNRVAVALASVEEAARDEGDVEEEGHTKDVNDRGDAMPVPTMGRAFSGRRKMKSSRRLPHVSVEECQRILAKEHLD